jgi:predicted nucleotidyltransferase
MLAPGILEKAVSTIVELANPERVIIFGSQASGAARSDSDLDILVVEDAIDKPRAESVRLRRALRDLPLSIDLIVCSLEDLQRWQRVPGSFLATVATSGTAVYRRE